MNTAAKDAASVVRRLREFYRDRGESEIFLPVDLNQLVEQVVMLTQPRWKDQALSNGATITMETRLQKVPLITGNESELREVLINLIFNAVDAMTGSGTIIISTSIEGGFVVLEVHDTGMGMTEEVRRRCMDPFFSTKSERGTGLGLAIVYGIIRRHEGSIDTKSEPGMGTSFIIRLPVRTEPRTARGKQQAGPSLRPLHVLVVDDEPTMRQVLVEYLTRDGHTVEVAADGREGLEKFHASRFDLIVTDKAIPEMSGDQLAAVIKRFTPNKPIILLTGFGDVMEASGEKPPGVDIIVSKPITLDAFREVLAKVRSFWLG
jgi:CheY-like chemotaxis protein